MVSDRTKKVSSPIKIDEIEDHPSQVSEMVFFYPDIKPTKFADEIFVCILLDSRFLRVEPLGVNRPQKVGQVKVRIILSCGSGIEPGSFHLNAVLSVCYCSSQCSF